MKLVQKIGLAVLVAAAFFSCKPNRLKVDISAIDETVKIVRFDQELFALGNNPSTGQLAALREHNPDFADLFSWKIIRVGSLDDDSTTSLMHLFLTDTMVTHAKELVDKQFSDFRKIEKPLIQAFKYYRYHFPDKPFPVIYTCVSGFNQSVFTAENLIGVSLDKYLGADCIYYDLLGIPEYKQRKMYPARIVPDVMYAWAITEFEISPAATSVLDHIIHEGKLLYFTEAMMPTAPDSLKIGFTEKQLKWCKMNEAQMWTYLIEKNMLYSTQRMDIMRYVNDGPYTNGFPLESPGRTGVWIGWQIVRRYMEKHPEITLPELMKNHNYLQILNGSGYSPQN